MHSKPIPAGGAARTGQPWFHRDDHGSVVVEIALIFPIFVALVIGGFEVWRGVEQIGRLSSAANAGAQFAVQSGKTDSTVSSRVHAAYAGDKTNFTVATSTYSQCVSGAVPSAGGSCTDGFNPIQYVQITVTDKFVPTFQFSPYGQLTLTRRAVAAIQ